MLSEQTVLWFSSLHFHSQKDFQQPSWECSAKEPGGTLASRACSIGVDGASNSLTLYLSVCSHIEILGAPQKSSWFCVLNLKCVCAFHMGMCVASVSNPEFTGARIVSALCGDRCI